MVTAKALGIPANKVDVRVLRLGGGFGGKVGTVLFIESLRN